MKRSASRRRESGMSIVAVCIATALLGIAAVFGARGISRVMASRSSVTGGEAYRDIDSAFRTALIAEIQAYLNDNTGTACKIPANFMNASVALGSWGTMARTPTFSFAGFLAQYPPAAKIANGTGAGSEYAWQSAAVARCQAAPVIPTGGGSPARFHFCVGFAPTGAADPTSVLASKTGFAEVTFFLQDFATSKNISCNAYNAVMQDELSAGSRDGGVGGVLYYSLFWGVSTSGTYTLKRHNEVVYVPGI